MIQVNRYTTVLSGKFEEKSKGNFSIEKVVIPKGFIIRTYCPGGYFYHDKLSRDFPIVKLMEGGRIWMSDTPMEQEGLRIPSIIAKGDILIIGLGLGLLLTLIRIHNTTVKSTTFVEKNREVATLVYSKMRSRKTTLELCDGETYLSNTDKKFDFIFIDIWAGFVAPIKEIDRWTNLAKRCLKENGNVRCWLQELYDRIKSKLPKEPILEPGFPANYDPCLICGKKLRNDYAGLCIDCANSLGVSEIYRK